MCVCVCMRVCMCIYMLLHSKVQYFSVLYCIVQYKWCLFALICHCETDEWCVKRSEERRICRLIWLCLSSNMPMRLQQQSCQLLERPRTIWQIDAVETRLTIQSLSFARTGNINGTDILEWIFNSFSVRDKFSGTEYLEIRERERERDRKQIETKTWSNTLENNCQFRFSFSEKFIRYLDLEMINQNVWSSDNGLKNQ